MMKWKACVFAGLVTVSASADIFKSPDILIESKLDYDFSELFITKFRKHLKNRNLEDPFKGRFDKPLLLNESQLEALLPESSKELFHDFGEAVGLNMLKAETKVWIHGLAYDVEGFRTNLKVRREEADGILVKSDFAADEVALTADKLTLSLVVPGKLNSPVFVIDVIRPSIKASEEKLINFFTEIKVQDNKDSFKLLLKSANFDQMAQRLVTERDDVHLEYEKIVIPKVSLKVGNKDIRFSPEKIENFIRSKHEAIKGILLAEAASKLRTQTTDIVSKVFEQYKLTKEYWVTSPTIKGKIGLGKFSSTDENDLEISIPGDFCTKERFDLLKEECVNNKVTKTSTSRINKKIHQESLHVMKDLIHDGDANIVASISEDYFNKLLVTTFDAGLWNQSLNNAGVSLGPNKMIMRLDKKGNSGTLILDVLYAPTKMEKILTGSTQIRFPLVMDISLSIEGRNDVPTVIVHLSGIDTTDDTLIYGRPLDNIVSTVNDVPRFKQKVAKAIRERLAVLQGTNLVELVYPELKGLGLENVDFQSDGNGRMNAMIKMEDLLEDSRHQK